jgi:hypothetical protein
VVALTNIKIRHSNRIFLGKLRKKLQWEVRVRQCVTVVMTCSDSKNPVRRKQTGITQHARLVWGEGVRIPCPGQSAGTDMDRHHPIQNHTVPECEGNQPLTSISLHVWSFTLTTPIRLQRVQFRHGPLNRLPYNGYRSRPNSPELCRYVVL